MPMRIVKLYGMLLIVPLTSCVCSAQPISSPSSATQVAQPLTAPHVPFEKYTLPNAMQIIRAVDHRIPKVHVNLWYHVGSKDEPQNRSGFAHLFEHMMFEGSKNAPGHYAKLIEAAGGYMNGTTSEDRTEFFETVPSGSLEYALWLESDRLATLPDAVTQERLDNQKSVVENERRQRIEIEPYGTGSILISENLYPVNHPYAHSVIGSHDDVRAATVPEVKQFFSTFYSPNNLSMAIVGDFNLDTTKHWISKYFGSIPPAPPMARPARWTPHLSGEKVVDVSDHVAEQRTYFAWTAPPYLSPNRQRLELAARMLSRRINADLVYSDKPLCSETSVHLEAHEDTSALIVIVSARSGASLTEIEQRVDAAIAKLAKDGGSADELQQTKRRAEYDELSRFDTLQSTAEVLNEGNLFAADPGYFNNDLNQIEATCTADIASVVHEYIDNRNRLLVRFHPDSSSVAEQSSNLDRTEAPPIHPDPPLEAPKVETARLANGLEVLVAERTDIPKVSVLLTTRAGVLLDPADKGGLAMMTVATMPMGTDTRSGTQIRDGMEAQSATLIESSVSVDAAGLGFEVLSGRAEAAFVVFADVVLHPAFRQYSMETNQRQFQDGLAEAKTVPGDIAESVWPTLLFGVSHPYARKVATLEGLKKVQRDDLRSFYHTYWKPDDSALVFAGDITLDRAVALAQKYLGGWEGKAPNFPAIPGPQNAAAGRIYLIDKPDAAQSVLVQILPSPGINSKDRFPLSLAMNVWGGMWASRLNSNLREGLGYTYGFASLIGLDTCCGTLRATGSVQTDKTKEAVIELDRQLHLLRDQPITEAEFEQAKKTNLQQSAAQFETSAAIVSRMGQLWSWALPVSALQGEVDGVQETSLAAVRTAVAQYVKPGAATLLIVGDRQRIESGLRQLNLGPIVLLDTDGTPSKADGRPSP